MVPLISPPALVAAGRLSPLLNVALIGLILNELRIHPPLEGEIPQSNRR